MQIKRIIGVVGVSDSLFPGADEWWAIVGRVFLELFPKAQFSVERQLYFPWQTHLMRSYASDIRDRHGHDGVNTMLFGHSLGGLVACEAALTMPNVQALLTMCTPHRLAFLWDVGTRSTVPLVAIAGTKDQFISPGLIEGAGVTVVRAPIGHFPLFSDTSGKELAQQIFAEAYAALPHVH